ncbi:MAG: 50S ribosomal protein L22 [Actinobacteria bacterium]|nr:50S ribosomal protein L22 [Actinomycetota bacterium]
MADEKDNKEKTDSKESKVDAPEAKAEKKEAAKKESKPAAKKDSKEKPAKKAEPKADKKEAKGKDEKAEKKAPAKRSRKKAEKAAEKPAKRRSRTPEEVPVVRASAKYVRVAPRKARLVADQVRGLHIEQARALLAFSPRGAARDIHKLIDSAAANAENNHDLVGDEMRIASITVDEGPTLRRYRPRALGRATPINKRTSHIAVALTPVEDD